jgi:tRNA-Thr(GGU) m(6)t(6)A37 methyltransferase TsaA
LQAVENGHRKAFDQFSDMPANPRGTLRDMLSLLRFKSGFNDQDLMPVIAYTPIGVIHSPFQTVEGTPIQPAGAAGIQGSIELEKEYVPGLKDLEGFSHIFLLYHFHLSQGFSLEVVPFLDDRPRGLFSTRAPKRPNAIGLSVVKLKGIHGPILYIEDVDILDGTPLLDIKPYVEQFDGARSTRAGWLTEASRKAAGRKADTRFT